MEVIKNHGYNPFNRSNLGFLSSDKISKSSLKGFIIEDVNLYHQPVEGPDIALLFFLVKLTVLIIGVKVNLKVLKVIRRQNSLLTEITMVLTYAQIIICPLNLIHSTTVVSIHPLNEVIGNWYCHLTSVLIDTYGILILSHSLFCAMMRYVFIIEHARIRSYGRERVKRYFLILYIVNCLIGVIWVRIEGPELSIIQNVNKCFGKDHKMFLLETSTMNVLKHRFWEYSISSTGHFYQEAIQIIRSISKACRMTIFCIMGFNVIEGILYYKIISYMNREHKESMTNLRNLLSSQRKALRHRRNLINIQITILSWWTEFFCYSCLFIASYLLGHENNIIVYCMQTFSLILYFIVLPCIILINDSNVKAQISDTECYIKILTMFNCQYSNSNEDESSS